MPELPSPPSQLQVRYPKKCQQAQASQHQCQAEGHPDLYKPGQLLPAQCHQGAIPPSQRARPETKSGGIMLEATISCSLAGLCSCLLAISAVDLTPSTIFCCTFLPLLLFGCPLFDRFLISSQVKSIAVKRHRKCGRLKMDTAVAYERRSLGKRG
jgi:hypothetical protein